MVERDTGQDDGDNLGLGGKGVVARIRRKSCYSVQKLNAHVEGKAVNSGSIMWLVNRRGAVRSGKR